MHKILFNHIAEHDMSIQQEETLDSLLVTTQARPSIIPSKSEIQKQLAWQDFKDGLSKWRIWWMLASQDIKLRYRRSVLGPFWITLSMAITVYSMGYLYAHLFHSDIVQYFPFLVAGMLSWALISTTITEVVETFPASDSVIKQIKLPYTLYIHRIIARNLIIFLHNSLVMLPIYLFFHQDVKINACTLLIIPDLALLYLLAFTYGLILALLGTRYRDISQITKSLIQVIFFLTPVMWNPSILSTKNRMIVELNPFYSFIELLRAPLIGQVPSLFNLSMSVFALAVGILICIKMFIPYRSRIIYWI